MMRLHQFPVTRFFDRLNGTDSDLLQAQGVFFGWCLRKVLCTPPRPDVRNSIGSLGPPVLSGQDKSALSGGVAGSAILILAECPGFRRLAMRRRAQTPIFRATRCAPNPGLAGSRVSGRAKAGRKWITHRKRPSTPAYSQCHNENCCGRVRANALKIPRKQRHLAFWSGASFGACIKPELCRNKRRSYKYQELIARHQLPHYRGKCLMHVISLKF